MEKDMNEDYILDELMITWMQCVKEELAEHGITGQLNVEFIEDEPDDSDEPMECNGDCFGCDCYDFDCHDDDEDEDFYDYEDQSEPEYVIGKEYTLAEKVADFYCGLIDNGLSVEEAMELTKYRTHSL